MSMKALYLLFGLIILCAAGTGAINTSLGYLDDQNLNQSTPFLIFGHVWYANNSPCNSSIVNITNVNTSAKWCADAVSDCNYYQTLLCAANLSAGDMLQWNVAGGAVFNTTNRAVDLIDLESGGIFDFDIILQLAPKIIQPNITSSDPPSPVHDIENATRIFNITVDQVVDVTWLINGSEVQTDMGVTDASYTNTSAVAGYWNVSAVANNTNGTVMQTWNWTVTAVLPPEITSYNPNTTVSDIKGATRIFNITVDQVVDVTWLINGSEVQTDMGVTDASYTNTSAVAGYWNVSAVANNTNGTVMQTWNWTVTAVLPPEITSYNPNTTVSDIKGATRIFNITVDQVVDVTWLINGSEVQTDMGVTDASYTNTSAVAGYWNVSAVANNTNGTVMQTWNWTVTAVLPPEITSYNPNTTVSDIKGATRIFNITIDQVVNVTWLINGTEVSDEADVNESFYTNTSASIGVWNVSAIAGNANGTTMREWVWNVTMLLPPNITAFAPPSPVHDTKNATRTFSITVDQVVNVTWLINGTEVFNETEVNKSSYTNTSAAIGFWNVTAVASNENGTDIQEWAWHVTMLPPPKITSFAPPPSPVFVIYGKVSYDNGSTCNSPFVVVTNLNKSKELIADNRTEEAFYQLVTSSAFANAGDVLRITASNNGMPVGNATLTMNQTNIGNGVIEMDINEMYLPDFTVTDVYLNPGKPVLGGAVEVSANITNYGVKNGTTVVGVYYDNTSMEIERTVTGAGSNSTDIISLPPGVLGARLHLKRVNIHNGEVAIYDGDGQMVERITHSGEDGVNTVQEEWTDWIYSENITIKIELLPPILSCIPSYTNLTWEDELNNGTIPEGFKDLLEFWCYSLSDNATVEKEGEDEWIIIDGGTKKYCIRKESEYLKVYLYDYSSYKYEGSFWLNEYEALIAEENVTLNATESKVISASWRTGAAYGGARDHNITVTADPRNTILETNETNNTLSEQVFVNGTDLTVTAIEIPCGDDCYNYCYVGQDVHVTATIANIGAADATNFTVEFWDVICSDDSGANTNGVNFNNVHIERLDSGKSMNIPVVIWNPTETTEIFNQTITASIPYDKYTDNNKTNNELSEYPEVDARYDFTVESVNVEPQDDVRRGESVNITATIGNIGHAGENVSIAFFVNSTDYAGTCGERFIRIGKIDDVRVELNETETVSIAWDVDVAGGCHLIAAVVNPDNEVKEAEGITPHGDVILFRGETGNNVKNCTLHVTPLDLNITNLTLVPAEPNIGDIVNVSAEIMNSGSAEANSTVWFYMEKDEPVSGRIFTGLWESSTWSWSSELQPEAQIRYHFDYIEIWRGGSVKASATNSVGEGHPVHFYVKCENCGGQDAKVPNIVFTTDCHEMDGDHRRWDDVWTDWTNGTEVKITAAIGGDSAIMLRIDKYQVRLGNETVTLHPGESMVYNSTWNTSPPLKAGEDYRLMVNVEDETGYTNTYLRGTDLAVTNLSVRSPVYDGDMVWVNATIENLGRMDATDFIVNITEVYTPTSTTHPDIWYDIRGDDHLEPIDTTHIEGLGAGNSIDISVLWNVSIQDIECEGLYTWGKTCPPWTEYECDDYTISVEINPLENKDKETNIANNTKKKDVDDVARSRDFKIREPSFWVNNESRNSSELVVYDNVTLNATLDITNLANQGGVVDVGFYIDDPCDTYKIGNTTVAFPAGNGTGYVQIEWNVDSFDDVDIVGRHNMTVVADPDNLIYEIDELNNVTVHPINVKASDPEVEFLDIHPVNPARNETVSIEVTIANYGEVDAGNVTLTIYDWAKRHIEDEDEQSGIGREPIVITEDDASAMRLYLDLEVESGSRVCVNDSSGKEIVCYHENFHGWTPWVLDNNITIVVINNGTDVAYAKVSKIYYLESGSIIDTSTHDLGVNVTKKIAVNWTPPTVGERLIAAIVDHEDRITEHDEVNNRLVELIQVQTADLAVSNLSLAWNGTGIGKNEIIKDGDDVRISANIANIGVEDAGSFDVRFLVDDLSIQNEVIGGLAPDGSICVSADWHVTVGDHLLKVEADYRNEIDETNETNNIAALEQYVYGAELFGNTSWETLGLHGEILFGPDQPYDEDEVNITARITNSGYLDATDFNAALFFDYMSDDEFQKKCGHFGLGGTWINRTYHGAEYVYINVTTPVDLHGDCRHIIKDDVIIYDGNGSEVARPVAGPGKPCWVRVNGDMVNVSITTQGGVEEPVFDIYFYPIYQDGTSMLFEGVDVPVNSSRNLLMKRNVSAGNRAVMFIIDPENKVPEDEDHRKDNTISRIMHVKPTRDFMVTNMTASHTNLSDLDTPNIIAGVANFGLRNGTTDVSFVDYEVEYRRYGYHLDANRSLSYLPIPPDARLSGLLYGEFMPIAYDNLMIIHRPGVDAIELRFDMISLPRTGMSSPCGVVAIYDEKENIIWSKAGHDDGFHCYGGCEDANIPLVPGETAYIYTNDQAHFDLGGYITETEFHREEVRLNATKEWNESKNITSNRTAYTGDHTIFVTLDGDDKITEISESNNELSSLFHVNASRDPVIFRINITPENPVDGDNVYITAFVANNGSKNASFTVDLWANLTRKKPGPDESLPEPDLTTDPGGDRIRYITLLKHEIVTLAPGENTTVNATWNDISIAGNPIHHIIAIIDPTDEIDEMNESNNEIVKEIIPNYPDLTIGTAYVPEGEVMPVIPIKELGGASRASGVTVRFEAYETEECTGSVHGWDKCNIYHPEASNMQVYFDGLDSRDGSVIVNDHYSIKNHIKKYKEATFAGVWGPWVEGDIVWIISMGGTTYARIGKYRWGNVSDAEQFDLHARMGKDVKMPWTEYREPYDLTITVDPDNNITELNEDNNNKTIRMGADIAVNRYVNVDPYAPIMGDTCYIREVQNIGNLHTGEFNVTISINATNEVAFEHNTTINKTISLAPNERYSFLWETPEIEPPDDIDYDISIVADPEDVVKELREDNNEGFGYATVFSHTNYTGGKLYLYDTDWVYGNINYTIGNSVYKGGWVDYKVNFEDVIPENIKENDIKLARLYLYWTWSKAYSINESKFVPVPIEVNLKFNDITISEDRRYLDYPHATDELFDVGWGTYTYEIPSDAVKPANSVIVDKSPFRDKYESDPYYENPYPFGIYGVGLLVIYEDDDGVLTNYWINEGGDVIYEGANALGIEDMVTTAAFKGKVEDEDMANATLWTVAPGGSNDETVLYLNKMGWGNVWSEDINIIGVDHRCVTEHLIAKDNTARLQYITGNSMMSSGAFLFVRYPPDLAVTDIEAPVSAVVGNKYVINTTISNEGISNATDFNVSFYSNRVRVGRQKISGLDSGDNITLQFNWKPMYMGKIYKLKVAADVVSGPDWVELDADNNVMTKYVPIVASGFGNESGPMGEGGSGAGGSGEGDGFSLFDTITGILMKGTILKDGSGGGGGGLGEFSLLEWLMKGLILTTCSLLVYLGYSMEKRRYNKR